VAGEDPIETFCSRLRDAEDLTSEEFEAIRSAVRAEVEEAVLFARESPVPDSRALLEDVFV